METFTNQEYVELYSIVYQMCTQKMPHCFTSKLYEYYEKCISEYLQSIALPAIQKLSGEYMIKELVKRWEDHKIMKKWLFDFFRYVDRFYVKRHAVPPLQEVCVVKFHTVVFAEIKERATSAILDLILADRNGEECDRGLLRDAIRIYVEMGMGTTDVYTREFEKPLIVATADFYGREAARWLQSDSCPEYLRRAEARLQQERSRLVDYLHSSSEKILLKTFSDSLLVQHQSEILGKENTGCDVMLRTHAKVDLSRMYQLYAAIPALEPIGDIVKKHISSVGLDLIEKVGKEQHNYIQELMKIHDKYYDLVKECFLGNAVFERALKEAFELVVNQRSFERSTAELLADFSDLVLKKGGLKLSEEELQPTLDNLVRLFSYLTDKDMFSEFYRKLLSKRLLLQRSASTDAEKSMIGKLKLRCGAQYTSKLEGMINDMKHADENALAFSHFLRDSSYDNNIDFQVQTLTKGFWPTYHDDELRLPRELTKCIDAFKAFYDSKTNNRRLTWIHKLGVVTITGHFTRRDVDLVVSTVQASILLLFNEQNVLSINELMKHTGLDSDNMKRQLRSLVSGKFKLLLKKPFAGYANDHQIKVNTAFSHQQRRVRIPNAVTKITAKERAVATGTVHEDRRHAIEATIVRVMKARKRLDHRQLMSEVSQQLFAMFKPDPKQIKRRIEDLIAREYLERDEQHSDVYKYLA